MRHRKKFENFRSEIRLKMRRIPQAAPRQCSADLVRTCRSAAEVGRRPAALICWLTGQLKLPFKNEYPAHLDASPPYFHAHLRFLIRHNFLAGRQAKFTTRPEHVAPWAWSCISSRTTPDLPRPFQIIQESDIRRRDRSKKYICSYRIIYL